jgi:enoyl-CoA hydratase
VIAREDRDGVRVLALARPPVNAIDLGLVQALGAALADAEADAGCRALVLTGAAGVFSAGIDTRRIPAYDAAQRAEMLRGLNRTVLALYAFPKPAVAAISGHALGGGLVLALCCDVRVAARGAFRLGLLEAIAGVPFPAGPLTAVRAELSPERARRLALTSVVFGPEDPLAEGVVDRVVAPEALPGEALAEARTLLAQPAFAAVKRQLRAEAVAKLRHIVAADDEPMLASWLPARPNDS